MTRLIGGLLVVSLLYSPAKYQVKYIAYNLTNKISNTEYLSKSGEDNKNVATKLDIDYAFDELDGNTRQISTLINEKNMLFNKIESELDLRSHFKLALNDDQINSFAFFMDCYNRESAVIQTNLKKIDERKNLSLAQRAILHTDANYDLIFSEISVINEYQNETIDSIMRIIDSGNDMLRIL